MRKESHSQTPAITVFAVINFVLAGLCVLWLLIIAAMLVYGVGFSGDEGEELAAGILGSVLLAIPGLVGVPVYLAAGLGLQWHRSWGYYFHCTGALLAALTCVGLVYTVAAFVFALRPEFSTTFFPVAKQMTIRRRRNANWDDY